MYFLSSLDPAVSSGGMGPQGLVPPSHNTPFPDFSVRTTGIAVDGQSGYSSASLHAPVRPTSPVGGPIVWGGGGGGSVPSGRDPITPGPINAGGPALNVEYYPTQRTNNGGGPTLNVEYYPTQRTPPVAPVGPVRGPVGRVPGVVATPVGGGLRHGPVAINPGNGAALTGGYATPGGGGLRYSPYRPGSSGNNRVAMPL
jgi:hypothetical protein